MSIDQKISQAKAKLLVDYPLFGTIASRLELIQNDDIQSFKSNGITLAYNSDFFQALELSEMEFVFANGAMHASLAHESRKNGRSGWLWQMATDYAVNDMLVENGMDRPDAAHYSKRFSGLYAEEIYSQLKEDILRDELEYEADNVDDIQNDNQKQNSSANPQQSQDEQLFEEFAKATLDAEMKNGEIPAKIERFFNLTCQGKIDWRDELKAALDRFHKDDYTLLPPSKKFLHIGIYLPSCISQRFKLVVAVDSSGSVDEKLLNEFLSELNFLMNTIQNYQIDLLVCDEKIHSHKTFYGGDILEADLSGGGATDFRPVFEFIEKELEDTKLLLYFSDLDGIFPHDAPNYEVKWIAPKEQNVPFGTVIMLE
jgi:predicted metal-dependent peptidase